MFPCDINEIKLIIHFGISRINLFKSSMDQGFERREEAGRYLSSITTLTIEQRSRESFHQY